MPAGAQHGCGVPYQAGQIALDGKTSARLASVREARWIDDDNVKALSLARRTGVTHAAIGGGLAGSELMRREISTRLKAGRLSVQDGVPDALEGAKRLGHRG